MTRYALSEPEVEVIERHGTDCDNGPRPGFGWRHVNKLEAVRASMLAYQYRSHQPATPSDALAAAMTDGTCVAKNSQPLTLMVRRVSALIGIALLLALLVLLVWTVHLHRINTQVESPTVGSLRGPAPDFTGDPA